MERWPTTPEGTGRGGSLTRSRGQWKRMLSADPAWSPASIPPSGSGAGPAMAVAGAHLVAQVQRPRAVGRTRFRFRNQRGGRRRPDRRRQRLLLRLVGNPASNYAVFAVAKTTPFATLYAAFDVDGYATLDLGGYQSATHALG